MSISVIDIKNRDLWNNCVYKLNDYEPFYLNEYATAFMNEDKSNGFPILMVYEKNKDFAINAVFKRDVADNKKFAGKIKKSKYFDLVSPYGYGGFIGNISDYDALNREYIQYCNENNFICEFVRFELFSEYYKYYNGEVETKTHNVIRNLEMSYDDIWMDFKKKVRKNVRRAKKNNLVFMADNGEHLEQFLDIYYSTMDRDNAESEFYFSKNFFLQINEMKHNVKYFYAIYKDKIISVELILFGSKNGYSYLGGTDSKYFDLRPNDFLKFEIIKWCKERGLKNFVLGGGYGSDDGIFNFKACLAPNGIVDFYIGKNIFNKQAYEHLCELRTDINENNFFPKYRT